jgi:fatty-acyl-CoA synthase
MGMQSVPLLMHRLIERGAVVCPNEEIVTATADGSRRQTYQQTRARAHQLAHALVAEGIKPGDRVATFMWNSATHLEVYWACAGLGVVLHTLNIRLGQTDLEYIINHAGDKLIITDADLLPALEIVKDSIPSVERIVVSAEPGFEDWTTELPGAIDYEAFIDAKPEQYDWPELPETSPLGLCYTSGTTGDPKGVEYEHRAQYLHTMTVMATDCMGISGTDTLCGIVPMFDAQGWGLPWVALTLGMKQVMPHRFMDPARIAQLMSDEKVTISAGVPTIWQGMKVLIEKHPEKYDFGALERLTVGGSAAPISLIKWYWDHLNVEMIQGWGMTETSPLGTTARRVSKRSHLALEPDQQFNNMAKAGQIMPGLEIRIVDDAGVDQPHDGQSVGEVLIRGPWICSEYFKNPQPEKFNDGWLVTGDVATIDEDEYLIITDRSKDLIKSGGEWISSVDLENHIVALPGVAQACAVAQPHPRWTERPVILIVVEPGASIQPTQVIEHCATRFAKWQLPDDVLFVDSIPLTTTGKMSKKLVRAKLEEDGYLLPDLR